MEDRSENIRDHQLVQQALLESEARFRAVFDEFPAGIVIVDRDGLALDVNPAMARITGFSADELRTMTFRNVTHPEDIGADAEMYRQLFDGEIDNYHREKRYLRKDGQIVWAHLHVAAIKEGAAQPRLALAMVEDISERKRIEQALRQSEERWQLAVNGANDGIWDWNPVTDALYWSPRCKEMLGYADGETPITRAAVAGLMHPDDHAKAWERAKAHLDGPEPYYRDEYRLRHKDGSYRWILARGIAIRDSQGRTTRFVGSHTDITDRKRAEQDHNELLARERGMRSEMEKANKAKDEFLAVLSHELRTPLTPILPAVQMLEQDQTLSASQRELMAMIRRNVELEARLIDDLLDLTRISKGKLELFLAPTDVHQKIRHVAAMFDSEIRSRHLTLELHLEAAAHHVQADAARFQQVLWNLLKNAVKFTPVDGAVGVRTNNNATGRLQVEVSDTGCGIDPELLPRIFDAFVQGTGEATRRQGGLGLGLTISKRLIEMLNGTLAAFSDGPGRGCRFVLELPVTSEAESPGCEGPATGAAPLERRILVVDDNVDTCTVMKIVLQSKGYDVRTADSVSAALQAVDAENFDLLVCDIGLPDGSGLDLMRQLLAKKSIKGIALSGYGMEEDVRRSKQAGFIDHLTKPVSMRQLEMVIRRHVGK
ncbi:MAG TPA: PAS domain S-box protein [Tepidisphaeraceae bacterium]|jgi:PAS domain S-box-containing protein|nr:PAS domain S-box protein [Tepidisphaeraceae bacterium]